MILILCLIGAPILGIATASYDNSESCILPPYPDHGTYQVAGAPAASPGDDLDTAFLNITCSLGYAVAGRNTIRCSQGAWSGPVPSCVRACKLKKHPSVVYQCLVKTPFGDGFQECEEYEGTGTVVKPECRRPNYYHQGVLPHMRCIDGTWDYVAKCTPECGRVTSEQPSDPSDETLPWHIFIYTKTYTPYLQICGGSLIKADAVISAAHCFWTHEGIKPASSFAVAAGKKNRQWTYPGDTNPQKSDVLSIKIPPTYMGEIRNFQDDIALVGLTTPVVFTSAVSPICLNFDYNMEKFQLKPGNFGKIPNWSVSPKVSNSSSLKLRTEKVAYIDTLECIQEMPVNFREYITGDKICAGNTNGLCDVISGNGLVFPEVEAGVTRHYLRGLASTSPRTDETGCNIKIIAFTQISKHEHFIKDNLSL